MVYETDEEQVEAIKKWWKENGVSVIAGVIIGLGALIGWRGWVSYHDNRAKAASEYYAQIREAVVQKNPQLIISNAQTLQDDYASTPYAALAALEVARIKAEEDDLEQVAVQLNWAMQHSPQELVRNVARLRLARVLHVQEKHDEALQLLSTDLPSGFLSLTEEIRGDVLRAKGEIDAARKAYNRAILSSTGSVDYLQMKKDELGEPAQSDAS